MVNQVRNAQNGIDNLGQMKSMLLWLAEVDITAQPKPPVPPKIPKPKKLKSPRPPMSRPAYTRLKEPTTFKIQRPSLLDGIDIRNPEKEKKGKIGRLFRKIIHR